ncbi:DUF4387 domain-containing protein [bacterium]|nr:DUF4387 domain-containing protein [bacterium]
MKKLYERADVFRSKNAGPFFITIDIIFNTEDDFERALNTKQIDQSVIAKSYGLKKDSVKIYYFSAALAVKVVFPRQISSGAPGDRDVYGAQQAGLLENIL